MAHLSFMLLCVCSQKRRMKQLEHAREVQRMVEDRRQQYQEQKAREEAEIAALSAEEVRLGGVEEAGMLCGWAVCRTRT